MDVSLAIAALSFAVWGSSRWDVLLHLLIWIVCGSFALGYLYDHDYFSLVLPNLVSTSDAVRMEMLEILPNYPLVLTTSMFLLCLVALFLFSSSPSKFTWLVFAAARICFPVVSSCECDIQPGGSISVFSLNYAVYAAFVFLSFVGPLSSVQTRTFVLADFFLYVYFHTLSTRGQCGGGEVAWLVVLLCVLHDCVVYFQLFVFVETIVFSTALVWAMHVLATYTEGGAMSTDTERAITFALLFWSLGMFLRTYSQGRMRFRYVLAAFAVPVVFSLTNSTSMAAAGAVACWTVAKQVSLGKRKAKHTRNYFSLQATSLFPLLPKDATQDLLDLEEAEMLASQKQKPMSFEEAVTQYDAIREESFDTKAVEEARAADPKLKSPVELREELIRNEEDAQAYLHKKIFYLEALSKGQSSSERATTLDDLQKFKQDLRESIDIKNKLLEE